MLNIIVACEENGGIGYKGNLPWPTMRADRRKFWKLTRRGGVVVMGRKTFEAVGHLSRRRILVLTKKEIPGVETITDIQEVLKLAETESVWVAGGEEPYRAFLPHAHMLHLTRVHTSLPADRFFSFDESQWRLLEKTEHTKDTENPYDHTFYIYGRRSPENMLQ